jgi:hypothetical protein
MLRPTYVSHDVFLASDRSHHQVNETYRRAILTALESQKDYRERSNIDSVRRHTQQLLEGHTWSDVLFLRALRHIVQHGEIEFSPASSVELVLDYKKRRAHALIQELDRRLAAEEMAIDVGPSPLRLVKECPIRKSEHDKFRIVPKKIYDHTA